MNSNNLMALADEHELKPGQMKKVEVNGKKLILANADGDYYLVDEMCSHEDFHCTWDVSGTEASSVPCMAVIST